MARTRRRSATPRRAAPRSSTDRRVPPHERLVLTADCEPSPKIGAQLGARIRAAATRAARDGLASSLRWGRLSQIELPPEHLRIAYLRASAPELFDVRADQLDDVASAFFEEQRSVRAAMIAVVENDLSREALLDAIASGDHVAAWMFPGWSPGDVAESVGRLDETPSSFDLAFICGAIRALSFNVQLLSTATSLASHLPRR